jgi:surface polysaccharide O-acyltransferase-like enzyme
MSRFTTDLLRVVCIIAVIIIHASSPWEYRANQSHQWLSADGFGCLLNQWGRFCVPLFVLLSGYVLTKRYADGAPAQSNRWVHFFKRRTLKIIIPYVVWTVAGMFLRQRVVWHENSSIVANSLQNVNLLFGYLTLRGVDYHFYFFRVIIQCYLLFALLLRFRTMKLWAVLALTHLATAYPLKGVLLGPALASASLPSSLFIFWIFYFYSGMLWATHEQRINLVVRRVPVAAWMGAASLCFVWVGGEYFIRAYHSPDPGTYNHFSRAAVALYALAVLLLTIRLDGWMSTNASFATPLISKLAQLSFGVYLFHVWILRLLRTTPLADNLPLFMSLSVVLSFGTLALLDILLRKRAAARVVVGLG